jgi:deoxyribodipyrimidine photo-lyase
MSSGRSAAKRMRLDTETSNSASTSPTASSSNANGGKAKATNATTAPKNTVVWFRNDLRLHDNPALSRSLSPLRQGKVIGLFVLCAREFKDHNLGPRKVDFILRNLRLLKASLETLKIPLLVKTVENPAAVPEKVLDVCLETNSDALTFNIEYEIDEKRGDEKIKMLLQSRGITVESFHDQCIVPPGEVLTKENRHYTVFTPFRNRWYAVLREKINDPLFAQPTPKTPQEAPLNISSDDIPSFVPGFELTREDARKMETLWPAGEAEALNRLNSFIENKSLKYKQDRDYPGVKGTSSLSPYLSIGAVSARHCFLEAQKKNNGKIETGNEGSICWISELAWRDFYRHIVFFIPRVCMYKPFKLETDAVKWRDSPQDFEKWCEGKTGYPLVDAAMRQLKETGWMHNRLRMVVAMFLTKHLLIDWRKGEKFFMNNLIDGDLASNNGGWQWSASTGCDSQPYFRIFNPITQSQNFDKEGKFIKKYIPELTAANQDEIHEPWKSSRFSRFQNYPKPMVEHTFARQRALDAYKQLPKAN